jgi:signal transduction histidine kinase
VATLGLPLVGYLYVLGEHRDWWGGSTTDALTVMSCASVVGGFTWAAARGLAGADRRRAQAIAELTDLRIDLERQVQDRVAQLQRGRNQIAVLEDRQRIAADLHDIVIQRLFAAGMFLQSGGATVADPEVRYRVDAAVEAMDAAIRDLRASIFELGGRVSTRQVLTSAIDEVCSESARVLGFNPDVIVDDPDLDAERVRDDILAVLREALANVARHAGATRVAVELRSYAGAVSLTVADDGKGITAGARSSGTRNMTERARDHGGDCTWTAVRPHGTKVHWFLPASVVADA